MQHIIHINRAAALSQFSKTTKLKIFQRSFPWNAFLFNHIITSHSHFVWTAQQNVWASFQTSEVFKTVSATIMTSDEQYKSLMKILSINVLLRLNSSSKRMLKCNHLISWWCLFLITFRSLWIWQLRHTETWKSQNFDRFNDSVQAHNWHIMWLNQSWSWIMVGCLNL